MQIRNTLKNKNNITTHIVNIDTHAYMRTYVCVISNVYRINEFLISFQCFIVFVKHIYLYASTCICTYKYRLHAILLLVMRFFAVKITNFHERIQATHTYIHILKRNYIEKYIKDKKEILYKLNLNCVWFDVLLHRYSFVHAHVVVLN